MSLLDKFYNPSQRVIGLLQRKVAAINDLESEISKLSDEELKKKTEEFKKKIKKCESVRGRECESEVLEEIAPEAFAVLREAMKRVWGERHFDVQLIGGLVLHQGKIAEMKTGEGKTIVAALPLYLNALSGRGVHLVTVNDYLSKHHGEGMGEVFNFLGLSTGIVQSNQETYRFIKNHTYKHYSECDGLNLEPCSRKEAYACDITYGTNNEFGFDYLRDNMAPSIEACSQRELHYAIVDEVDSILIDEARTPLIISAPAEESAALYQQFAGLVPRLKVDQDFIVDEKDKTVNLTDAGIAAMEKLLNVKNIYEAGGITLVHHLEQALKAHTLFKKDKDYVVREGEIVIVDEFTGRLMVGRRYSEGLHQAIEAKESVEVKQESQTLATISFQNLFRMYDKLAGMTGTAATEAEEFYKIYKLDVVEIPTNKRVVRADLPDRIYKTEAGKFNAVAQDVKERTGKGQPVLIGTASVEKNEEFSRLLSKIGVKHELLNAKNHEREARIIANAGLKGAVTVATNMAGRGTDIKLGVGVRELGGLHVIGSERHEARRIDNQLRGRSGRQGDPGSSQFFTSMDDDLMRIFGGDKLKNIMNSLGLPEDMPIENKIISRSIESAQRRVEGHNFDIRKHLVEYDDVMNKHREVIYRKRRRILELGEVQPHRDDGQKGQRTTDDNSTPLLPEERLGEEGESKEPEYVNLKEEILDIVADEIDSVFTLYPEDQEKIKVELSAIFGVSEFPGLDQEKLKEFAADLYDEREKKFGSEIIRQIERMVYLRTIDMLWVEHLTTMDELRTGIGLRGYGQRDPLVEYKQEAYQMFQSLLKNVESSVARTIYRVEITVNQPAVAPVENKPLEYHQPDADRVGDFEPGMDDERSNNEQRTGDVGSPPLQEPVPDSIREGVGGGIGQNNLAKEQARQAATAKIADKGVSVYERMKQSNTGPTSQVKKPAGKVGRNDPCPCGSGKKYKKCHGK